MNRSQFTFYESFAIALRRIRSKAARCDAYDAIVDYALYGTEPDMEKLADKAAIAIELIRPHLDTSRRKAACGQLGGLAGAKAKQNGSKYKREYKNKFEYEFETEKERQARLDRMQREQAAAHTTIEELTAVLESMTGP